MGTRHFCRPVAPEIIFPNLQVLNPFLKIRKPNQAHIYVGIKPKSPRPQELLCKDGWHKSYQKKQLCVILGSSFRADVFYGVDFHPFGLQELLNAVKMWAVRYRFWLQMPSPASGSSTCMLDTVDKSLHRRVIHLYWCQWAVFWWFSCTVAALQ